MKFEVGDVIRLTKSGWARSFRRDPGISPGALAIVKDISWDTELYACEFFQPAKSVWFHNCGGACHDGGEFKKFPGYQYDFVGGDCGCTEETPAQNDAQVVAEITKRVMEQLGMK